MSLSNRSFFALIVLFSVLLTGWGDRAVADVLGAAVQNPGVGLPAKVAPSVVFEQDAPERVSILRFDGDYHRSTEAGTANLEARQAVSQVFYQDHDDLYDFLVVFTTFDYEMAGADGFYISVKNDTTGIGLDLFDYSNAFGSTQDEGPGRLQGYVDMGNIGSWQLNARHPDFEDLLNTLGHELMHRWCCFVDVDSPDLAADVLRGADDSHWSDLLDSGASLLYGHDWLDRGDGSFDSLAVRKFYGPLDLYLAGFLRPDQVSDLLLIHNPALDPTVLPELRQTVEGDAGAVSIQDVIAAEGPRSPSAMDSQKSFRAAFLLLTQPGEQVDPAHLVGLDRLRREFATRFSILTGGQGRLEIYPEGRPTETGSPTTGTSTGETLGQADPSLAMQWLRDRQLPNGSWLDKQGTDLRDTQVVFDVLSTLDGAFTGGPAALSWLGDHTSRSTDDLARRLLALVGSGTPLQPAIAELQARQNSDGGWGPDRGFASDALDTALAIQALSAAGSPSAVAGGLSFLRQAEQAQGGWSSVAGGPSRSTVTTQVARALMAAGFGADPAVTRAVAWLATKQNPDGGFGDSPSSVHDTANVLSTLLALDSIASVDRAAAEAYLVSRQQVNGSWDGSVYATALAVRTLRSSGTPNFVVESPVPTPAAPRDGERVTFSIPVGNLGGVASSVTLVLYDGEPENGVVVGELSVPDLAPAEQRWVDVDWSSFDQTGAHRFVVVVDPDGEVAEASELDNRAFVDLEVAAAPEGAELEARPGDIQIVPPDPNELPAPLAIFLTLRNLGRQDANQSRVRLWRGEAGSGDILHDQLYDLPGRSSTPVNLLDNLELPGTTSYTLELDADNTAAEDDESDNVASTLVITRPNLDLEVLDSDLRSAGGSPVVGGDIEFEIDVRNRGTVDLERNVELQLAMLDAEGTVMEELPPRSVFLAAGELQTYATAWRASAEGNFVLRASLDLSGTPLVLDSNPDNQVGLLAFQVTANTQPNLSARQDSWTLNPTPALEGAPLIVGVVIENSAVPIGPFEVRLYDGHPDNGQSLGLVAVDGLGAGESMPVEFTWSAVPDADQHTLFLKLDDGEIHEEITEDDNIAFVSVRGLSLADAAVSAASIAIQPSFPRPGQPISLTAELANLGEQAMNGLRVRLHRGSVDGEVLAETLVPTLGGGASATASLGFLAPAFGTETLYVVVNPDGELVERSLANNTATVELSVQDGDVTADPRMFSPNGDGVLDTTTLFLRLATEGTVSVEIENERHQEVIRSFEAVAVDGDARLEWDGRADSGALADDGTYVLRVTDAEGAWLGEARVTIDTNRSPLLDALGTSFALEKNLSCELPEMGEPMVTDDEQWLYFRIGEAKAGYPAGIYRMALDGSSLTPLVTLSANKKLPYYGISGDGSTIRIIVDPPSGSNYAEILTLDGHRGSFAGLEGSYMGIDATGDYVYALTTDRILRESTYNMQAAGQEVVYLPGLRSGWSRNVSPSRRSVVFRRSGSIYIADLETGLGGQAMVGSTAARWSWDGTRLLVSLRESEVGEGGVGLDGTRVAIYRSDATLERIVELPLDPMPSELYDGPSWWDPAVAGSIARFKEATWDASGQRVAVQMEYEIELIGQRVVGSRYVVIDVDSGATETIAWSVPSYTCEGCGSDPDVGAVISPDLIPADASLWVPHNEALVYWVGSGGSQATAGFFSGSRVPFLTQKNRLAGLRTSETGHWLLASDNTYGDPTSACVGNSQLWMLRSLQNLTADLRVRRTADGTAILEGTAADVHFRSYQLEYASVDSPDQWSPIAPPSSSPVFDDVFQPWAAPAAGTYLVRLTVEDKAGNQRSAIRRVSAEAPAGVADVYLSSNIFSPNGDGVVDQVELRYRTLGPWVAELEIENSSGQIVQSTSRVHSQSEESSLVWDGRNFHGQRVADGVYRLRFGVFQFDVRVDTRAPELNIWVLEPYTLYNNEPVIEPELVALALKDRPAEQIEAAVEVGEGATPSTWQHFLELSEVDPAAAGNAGEFGEDLPLSEEELLAYIENNDLSVEELVELSMAYAVATGLRTELVARTLSLEQITGVRYRTRADDEVGNESVLAGPLVAEKLMLLGLHEFEPGAVAGRLHPSILKRLIEQNSSESFIALPVIRMGGTQAHFQVGETLVAGIDRLDLQYRQPGAAGWSSLPVFEFLNPQGGVLSRPTQGQFEMVVDLSQIPAVETHELRLRALDDLSIEHVSKRFRVGGTCRPMELIGILEDLDAPFAGSSCLDEQAVRQTLRELVDELGLDIAAETVVWAWEALIDEPRDVKLRISSSEDSAFFVPQTFRPLAVREGVMIFLPRLECDEYRAGLSLTGESLTSDGQVVTSAVEDVKSLWLQGGCLNVAGWPEIVAAESCDDAPPGQAVIALRASGEDLEVLRLEREDGQVLFNQPAPVDGLRYEYLLDFDDYPEDGVIRLIASAQNASGRARRHTIRVPIDRTPPNVQITFPGDGQLVCGYSNRGLKLAVSVRDDIPASVGDLLPFTAADPVALYGEEHERALDHSAWYGFGALPLIWNRASGEPGNIHAAEGAVLFDGDIAELPPLDAQISARVEVVGLGGHRVCAQSTFTVDTLVQPVPAPTDTRLYLSPNGDGFKDQLILPLQAVGESVLVDLEIRSGFNIKAGKCLAPSGDPVARPASDLPVPGATSTEWDGSQLADGPYTATLATRDACGNRALSSVCVMLDTVPPTVAFVEPYAGAELPTLVDIEVTSQGSDVSTYYGVGAAPSSWRPIPRVFGNRFQWNTSGLAEGPYTLRAVAIDDAGNQGEALLPVNLGPRPGLITYLEATPPLFSPQGDGVLDATTLRFGLAQAASVTAEVRLSGSTVRALRVSESFNEGAATLGWDGKNDDGEIVADGTYVLWLRAEANPDGQPLVQIEQTSVVVDTTAPTIGFAAPVDGGFLTGAAVASAEVEDLHLEFWSLSYASGSGAPIWQVLTEGQQASVAAPLQLTEGPWRLLLEARDAGGNLAESVVSFTVDSTPPVVVLTAPSPGKVVGPAAGPVEVSATIIEQFLDPQDPQAVILETVGADGTGTVVPFDLSGSAAGYQLSAQWNPAGLADGPYALRLTVTDRAGQVGISSTEVVVDSTPPQAVISIPSEGAYITGPTTIRGTAADDHFRLYELEVAPAGSGLWSVLGLGTEAVVAGQLRSWTDLPSDGAYDLRLRVEDLAGWLSESLVSFHIDTHPPSIPTGLRVQGADGNAVLSWNNAPEADVTGWNVYRDGALLPGLVPVAGGPAFVDPGLGEGKYEYTVQAVDAAGLESERSASVTLEIDFTPPNVSLVSPLEGARVSALVDIRGSAFSVDFLEYRLWLSAEDGSSPQLLRRSPVPVQVDELAQWSTLGLAEESRWRLRLEAEDLQGNEDFDEVVVTVDNAPPSAPADLSAAKTGTQQITVTWTASTEPDVIGYLLYRDDRLANVDGPVVGDLRPYLIATTSYQDKQLPDGTFVYTAYAMDAAGNVSDPSNEDSATIENGAPHGQWLRPDDGTAFELPLDLQVTVADQDGIRVRFDWRPVGGVWSELTTRDEGPYVAELDPEALGLSFGDYEVRAVASDDSGNTDPSPESRNVTYADVLPPAVAEGLTSQVDGDSVSLSWQADAEDPTVRYHVERWVEEGWLRLTSVPVAATEFIDDGSAGGGLAEGTHLYAVVAVDVADNEADRSASVDARVYRPTLVRPFSPTRSSWVAFTGSGLSAATAEISVDRPSGNEQWSLPTSQSGEFSFDVALDLVPEFGPAGGIHGVTVVLVDDDGNRSLPAAAQVQRGNTPSAPQGLVDSGVGSDVSLAWETNPESDLAGYRIFENGEPVLADQPIPLTSVVDQGGQTRTTPVDGDLATRYGMSVGDWIEIPLASSRLVSEVTISWGLSSADPGTFFGADLFRLEAAHGPAWVTLAEVDGSTQAVSTVILTDAYYTDTLRLTVLRAIQGEGGELATAVAELGVSERPLLSTDPTAWSTVIANGIFSHTVSAVAVTGFESLPSTATPERTVGDVEPPEAPVLQGSLAGSDVNLSWTTPIDAVRFELYRDGLEIASTSSSSFVDVSRPNGIYAYSVAAFDEAGNRSDLSNEVSVTVSVGLPGAPDLDFIGVDDQQYIIFMDWNAPEGPPVNVYAIQRSTTPGGPYEEVGRKSAEGYLRFSDYSVLYDQRYYYVVVAYDALGNAGPPSVELSAEVPMPDGAQPSLHYPTVAGVPVSAEVGTQTLAGRGAWNITVDIQRGGESVGTAIPRQSSDYQATNYYCLQADRPLWPSFDGRYLWVECGDQPVLMDWNDASWTDLGLGAGSARWLSRGHEVIFTTAAGEVQRLSIQDGGIEPGSTEVLTSGAIQLAVPSNDGSRLAILADREGVAGLWLLDPATDMWSLLHELGSSYFSMDLESLAWSFDDQHLVWIRGTSVEVLDLSDGSVNLVTGTTDPDVMPDWGPNENRLLYAEAGGSAGSGEGGGEGGEGGEGGGEGGGSPVGWIYSVIDGTRQQIVNRFAQTRFGWGPDGRELWVEEAGEGLYIEIMDLATGEFESLVEGSDGNGRNRAHWNPAGYFFLMDEIYPARIEPHGRWQLADVPLVDGANVFTASVGSAESDPIVVNYGGGDGGGPTDPDPSDLVLELYAVPSTLWVGESVRVTALVRNHGPADAEPSDLTLVVSGPDGFFLELANDLQVGALAAGGVATLAFEWQAPVAGTYTVAGGVDVAGVVFETDEANNSAAVSVRAIAVGEGPEMTLQTDGTTYAMNQTVRADLSILQTAVEPWSGHADLRLVDAEGYEVAFIGRQSVVELGLGETVELQYQWPVAGTFAGTYTLLADLVDEHGATVATDSAAFSILASFELAAEVSSDRPTYPVGASVRLETAFDYVAGNTLLQGVEVRTVVWAEDLTEVVSFVHSPGILLPGSVGSFGDFWTAQTVGSYQVEVEIQQGQEVLTTASTVFQVSEAELDLTGNVNLSSLSGWVDSVPAGEPIPLEWDLEQIAGETLAQLELRWVLRSSDNPDGTVVFHQELLDPFQGSAAGLVDLPTEGMGIGEYLLTFEALVTGPSGDVWMVIDGLRVDLEDQVAPLVAILNPENGDLSRSTITVNVSVNDQQSVIERVDIRLDGGQWSRASETGAALYSLSFAGLLEGDHTLEARTFDGAGNMGLAEPVTFVVDLSPPEIEILGVEDGGVYGSAVTPIIQVTDAHGVSHTVSLDGAAFASGSLVELGGEHSLQVHALDAAGNSASVTVIFTIQEGDPQLYGTLRDSLLLDVEGDGVAGPGDRLRYSVRIHNVGDGPATDVELSVDPIAGGLAVGSGTTTSHGVVVTEMSVLDALRIDVGAVSSGETVSITFEVDIDPSLAVDSTWIATQGRVTSLELADVFTDDPDTEPLGDRTLTPVRPLDTLRCSTDAFDTAPAPAQWHLAQVGDADLGGMSQVDGRLRVSGNGSSLYHGDDNAVFAYQETTGDFRIEVDIVDLPSDFGGQYRKAGLMIRSSATEDAARLMAMYIPDFPTGKPALQFDVRLADGAVATELASTVQNVSLPVRVAFTRRGDLWTVSYSRDGVEWIDPLGGAGGTVEVAMTGPVMAGMAVASYDPQQAFGVDFDDFRLCHRNDLPLVDPGLGPTCNADEPLDFFYLLDLSQSMKAYLADGSAVKLDAARDLLSDLHGRLSLDRPNSRASLVTFAGSDDAIFNLNESVAEVVPITDDLGSVASVVAGLSIADVPNLASTPTSIAVDRIRELIEASAEQGRRPVLIWLTDGLPNIDRSGFGPSAYRLNHIQEISLLDPAGLFRPWGEVAWLGRFNGDLSTFDGEPLANTMAALDDLAASHWQLAAHGIALLGDGVELGTYHEEIVLYGARATGGSASSMTSSGDISAIVDALYAEFVCQEVP